jgi:3-hydroxyacyl-CoA dehydrogenase/enoyl-CoA hydratase/3-hydroxybutyryl-CoA epimerase
MTALTVVYKDAFAYVTIDQPGEAVNTFGRSLLDELDQLINTLDAAPAVQWVVVESAKKGVFIAGADIRELQSATSADDVAALISRGQEVFNRWAALSAKTVALINGAALGGGLEFALACDYVVVTNADTVRLGLPEVNLGIIPGWGGTQRLPKRIGVLPAIQHIVSGKPVSGKRALAMGLADAMVSAAFGQASLNQWIQSKQLKRRCPSRWVRVMTYLPFFNSIVRRMVRSAIIKTTKGMYPAPLMALDVVLKTHRGSLRDGLIRERDAIKALVAAPIPQYLIALFFAQESVKKQVPSGTTQRSIHQVGVIGAGLMGGGIGWWFINHGQAVRFMDMSWSMIYKGYSAASAIIQKGVKRKKITAREAMVMRRRMTGTVTYLGFEIMDLVIEAVPEKMALKQEVLATIERHVDEQAIIATNTSSLSIDDMATCLKNPQRFLGIHFFSPVHKMPLVEIIPSEQTSPDVVADVCRMVIANKKFPIIVKNCPGFLVNRLLLPYVNEAIHILLEGYPIAKIDRIATAFGMPIGPLALADEVGLDIGLHVLTVLEAGYGDRMMVPKVLDQLVTADRFLGKKSGMGFYIHTSKKTVPHDALYDRLSINQKHRVSPSESEVIRDRLLLIMVNEAARCLDEKVVASPQLLDMAMVMGTGFPPFRGGLLRYADAVGIHGIVDRLTQLAQRVNTRFAPCSYLQTMAKDNTLFYRKD